MERWKKIVGFENYSVSDMGRVRNDRTGKMLKGCTKVNGYQQVNLYPGQKMVSVHRLVALAFIPNPDNLPQVNHKSEDKTDNRASNLEWCSAQYNTNYGTGHKRAINNRTGKNAQKRCIVDGVEYISVHEAERQLGFPPCSVIKALLRGQTHYKQHTISYC